MIAVQNVSRIRILFTIVLVGVAALLAWSPATASATPDTLPPYNERGPELNNTNPHTTQCDSRGGYRVVSTPILNLDMLNPSNSYTSTIGTADLYYSSYCGTNWIVTTLDDKSGTNVIKQFIYLPNDGYPTSYYTDTQKDTASQAFTLQVFAPDNTGTQWDVEVFNAAGYKIGWAQGGCGTACNYMQLD